MLCRSRLPRTYITFPWHHSDAAPAGALDRIRFLLRICPSCSAMSRGTCGRLTELLGDRRGRRSCPRPAAEFCRGKTGGRLPEDLVGLPGNKTVWLERSPCRRAACPVRAASDRADPCGHAGERGTGRGPPNPPAHRTKRASARCSARWETELSAALFLHHRCGSSAAVRRPSAIAARNSS